MFKNIEERKNCPMRHECGNCLPAWGLLRKRRAR